MKVMSYNLLLAFQLLGANGLADEGTEGFSLLKRENNMELSERWIKVKGKEDRREVRLVMQVDAARDAILEILLDESKGTEWNVNAKDYRIEKKSEHQFISYIRYDLPFPLSDRECYFLNRVSHKGKEVTINFHTYESDMFSKEANSEKIMGLEGKWVVREFEGYCELAYHVISVPDQSLPGWIVDPIIRKNLWATMENLRTNIENR